MNTHRFKLCIAALGLALTFVGAPAFAASATTAVESGEAETAAASGNTSSEPAVAPVNRAAVYARREATTPQAAEFKGKGAGIYIGGSTAAVVLVIVLVVILL